MPKQKYLKMSKIINEIKNKSNVENVIKEINNVCDEILKYVEKLRTDLLNQVFFFIFCFRSLIEFSLI